MQKSDVISHHGFEGKMLNNEEKNILLMALGKNSKLCGGRGGGQLKLAWDWGTLTTSDW